jgi:hypothetical protein
MNQPMYLTAGMVLLAVSLTSCSGRPDKVTGEKRVREALVKASPEWKFVSFDTRANDTVFVVQASRPEDGKPYTFTFTGGGDGAGVGVQDGGGKWLCKYRYEQGKDVDATKMDGADADLAKFRSVAAEFAGVTSGAVR